MADAYVKHPDRFTALRDESGDVITELLWGDPVHLEAPWSDDTTWAHVRARGRTGKIRKSELRRRSDTFDGLLEFYVIDVEQGDSVLCRTPDGRWHLIDAGRPCSALMTKKGAANFLRWKFYSDLRMGRITLHSLTASHPDYDHFGGMLDLLSGQLFDGRTFDIQVDHFYHCGMGRFTGSDPLGKQRQGTVGAFPSDRGLTKKDRFIVQLLDDHASFNAAADSFTDDFRQLADLVVAKCGASGRVCTEDGHLPGYAPGDGPVTIRILGPVVERFQQQLGLRRLGTGSAWESKTRNGHSVVYRFDYGNARILMTGDLNAESQRLLLSYVDEAEYATDVAKGCHHGSDDVEIGFVQAMGARATVISSGDNETYVHPRPRILGASARYGRESLTPDGEVMPPLLYSTELARSVALDYATSVRLDPDFGGPQEPRWFSAKTTEIKTKNTKYRLLKHVPITTDLVYGLVNVRTDGETVLCATMVEGGSGFEKRLFRAGVEVP